MSGVLAPHPVQARVHDDAVQPRCHGRIATEAGRRPVRREQRVLDGVRRLLGVAERSQRHGPEPIPMPADQLREGVPVSAAVPLQQLCVRPGYIGPACCHGVTLHAE
jgi:hypothetical protein